MQDLIPQNSSVNTVLALASLYSQCWKQHQGTGEHIMESVYILKVITA